ncbi:hypothetical protein PAXRUDRAFT_15883 [Paxillus rubicundulus Ve08.2h10]|uniref:Uncharacterized protein n=1 Tax=Paxillus rubicundulus Ve08.2h10 TaxID=930991 RepID=A0A0D0CBQ0_9AGAM|nr:hypothetical protein PAXRUDRAFT_15883 [Paxillus rubicundulus Ve08.2h10]
MSTEHDLQVCKNILILTVDNLLSGWPTYLIDFTPEQLGPMKILLHLKKPSKYVWDSDDKDFDKTLDPAIHMKRKNVAISVDISLALKQDEAYRIIRKDVEAIPVNLDGIPLGLKLKKRDKFIEDLPGDTPWPPIWPCSLCVISCNVPTTSLHIIQTTPALVKAIPTGKENTA